MELVRDNVRVELEHIGEGWQGEYDETDPDDTPLLRFTVSKLVDGEWQEVNDASYCTQLPDSISEDDRNRVMQYIMEHVYSSVMSGISIKRMCEHMSWLSEKSLH